MRGAPRGARAITAAALLAVAAGPARAAGPLTVAAVRIEGNRKVEDDAIREVVQTRAGQPLSRAAVARDVRAIWGLGYFDDVSVRLERTPRGAIVTFVVREKPSVRKIIVAGNDEVDLDKINEVLDLKREAILDVAQVKRNAEKIRDLYLEKGFYLADVSYRVVPAGPGQVDIRFDVEENAKVVIRRITFIGNRALKAAELKRVMATQEGGFLSFLTSAGTYQEGAFDRDLLMLTALYYDRGYVDVKIGSPRVVLSADKRYLYVTIDVSEGPRYKIASVAAREKVSGKAKPLFTASDLTKRLKLRKGQWFKRTTLAKDMNALTRLYKDRGYAYVNVTPLTTVDRDARTIAVTFEVGKGEVVTFERIEIRGNTKTRDKVIRRELKVAEGDRFSQTLLDQSRARVIQLGFFENVDVTTRRGSADDKLVATFQVKERPTGTFQIGAGFSSVESFIAQAQISQNNLFGRGQRLTLQAQISGLRQLFSLGFWEPYFLDTRWTFGFDIFNSLRNFDSFNRNALGGSLTWGYPITDDIRVFVTYKAEQVDVSTRGRGTLFGSGLTSPLPAGVQLANLFDDGFTSSVRVQVQWDTRNNRLFPSKGFYHAAWAEFAHQALGSQNVFNRFGAFSRFYYPIWGPFIFKFNAQIGLVFSSDPKGVPIFERFFTGGITDVRGFRPRSLGPRIPVLSSLDPNAGVFFFNKGGNKELVFNAEIEFPIFKQVGIRGVIFTDAGMAYDDGEDISFEALRHSWGFGFRWFSPIGPLRFEWGLPFDPNPGEDPVVFEFTIGNFF